MIKPTIYIISDGKPGHLAQTRGLAETIARKAPVDIEELDAFALDLDYHRYPPVHGLVLAAGRRAYEPALRAGKYLKKPVIVLMNPGWLMRNKFDLCIIPRHDGVKESANVITTEGALNGIQPAANASAGQALLLVGGPSKHHSWDDAQFAEQVTQLLEREPNLHWTATSSRRTPDTTDKRLHGFADQYGDRFDYTPAAQTPRGWVAAQLERCATSWVTEDSVSMVYESLTAGARVGLLDVPRKGKPGRVVRGVESLVERGWVTAYRDWLEGKSLETDRPPLAEADRVAGVILDRWPNLNPWS